MKKGVLGIISLIVAVAALLSAFAVIYSANNSEEREIVSFIKNVDSCNSEKIANTLGISNQSTGTFSVEDKNELISALGFSLSGLPTVNEETAKIDSITVAGMSKIELTEDEKSILSGASTIIGKNIKNLSQYDIMLKYTATDENGEEIAVYTTETVYLVKVGNQIKFIF